MASASPRFDPAVNALLDANGHPLRTEIDALRAIILDADGTIEEGVKWNAASFRTTEWFATLNGPKQAKDPMLVLHAGAKAKGIVLKDRVPDPNAMIKWLGKDRGLITFGSSADIKSRSKALQAVLRAWIELI